MSTFYDHQFNPYLVACSKYSMDHCPTPDKSLALRTVRWFELVLFTESNGGYTKIYEDDHNNPRIIPTPAGTLLFRRPGMIIESMTAFTSYNITFDTLFDPNLVNYYKERHFKKPPNLLLETLSRRHCSFFDQIPESLHIDHYDEFEALFLEAMALHMERPDRYYMKTRRVLYDLLAMIFDEVERHKALVAYEENPTWIEMDALTKWMEENSHQPITLELLSSKLGYTRETYCRLFKKHYGTTPINYLINYRIIQSKSLLLTTDMTLEAIAHQIGFKSHIHYCSTFKKRVGISPGRYRQNHRLIL